MRTLEQRRAIYNIVKSRITQGMSVREARANIEYEGKVFELDNKTYKAYAQEFETGLPTQEPESELAHAEPEPGHELAQVPARSSRKVAFLVRLSSARLDQLKTQATKRDKPYTSLAAEYIVEGLEQNNS